MTKPTRREFVAAAAGFAGLHCLRTFWQPTNRFDAIKTRQQWNSFRQQVLENMQLVMGPLPRTGDVSLDRIDLERTETAAFSRVKLTYLAERDDRVSAYLLVPRNLGKRTCGILCLHQTVQIGKEEPAGLGGNPNLHYAKELAENGCVTLAPDYPNFGDYKSDPYQRGYASATMKGICNHRRAVDLLQSLPEVAPDRIGAIGHSLGGHNALFVAAFDERIRAVVTSCGFTSFRKYYGGDLTGWSHRGYMPRIAEKYGKDPRRMPFDFDEILACLAPRAVFINAPLRDTNFEVSGVQDCVEAARPVYSRIFAAADRLKVVYPDAGHAFPQQIRQAAYEFVHRHLAS